MRPLFLAPGLLAACFLAAACDPQPDATSKEMTGPQGASSATQDVAGTGTQPDAAQPGEAGHDGTAEANHPEAGSRLEAHVHGHAELAVAVDGDEVTLTFEAPLMSLVGFEHEAQTDEQDAALQEVKDTFTVPGSMVAFNREAACLPLMTTSGTHMTGDHGGLEVEHVYTCDAPDKIRTIEFLLMDRYPNLQAIGAVYLSETSQVATELSPGNPVLKVR
ncbi:DUF2796 domain-containing protein [Henriciella sp.]|uniref:ZrgA family zinc uptake protein n=1 Tax=Henriciella sp. TaxID=1968823 RepID=UPI00262BCF67|nr:DUF2796 domain-containing protein [Henriciella sp.]